LPAAQQTGWIRADRRAFPGSVARCATNGLVQVVSARPYQASLPLPQQKGEMTDYRGVQGRSQGRARPIC
jgi:hypothetical protein